MKKSPAFAARRAALLAPFVVSGVACASPLFSSDFEDYSLGSVNGQFGWTVGGDGSDGRIVDLGLNRVLAISAVYDWGDEVRHALDTPATKRFIRVEVDFRVEEMPTGAFWFMDNNSTPNHDPDTLFWVEDYARTNARPGGSLMNYAPHGFYHFGIEIDQTGRNIIGVNHHGAWFAEEDTELTPASFLDFFVFRGYHGNAGDQGHEFLLYLDNLRIEDDDIARTPAPGAIALFGLACTAFFFHLRRRA